MRASQILSKADVKRRNRARSYASTLRDFDSKQGLFEFNTSGEELYTQYVKIHPRDWRLVSKDFKDLSMYEAFEKLQEKIGNINILVDCECPDFTFGGFAYLATKLGYGIRTESRAPIKRNKRLRGSVCKHLISVLSQLV